MADRKLILVADDDPDLRDLLNAHLTSLGYAVVMAADGKEALRLALDAKPALVLLDIMMPYLNGYHVASAITQKLGRDSPRVLIMTSRDTEREKGIARLSGAHEMIQKPFELKELGERIVRLLGDSQQDQDL